MIRSAIRDRRQGVVNVYAAVQKEDLDEKPFSHCLLSHTIVSVSGGPQICRLDVPFIAWTLASQILLEPACRHTHREGKQPREGKHHERWMQAERQRQIGHPAAHQQGYGRAFGPMVDKRAFPPPAPSSSPSPSQFPSPPPSHTPCRPLTSRDLTPPHFILSRRT